MAPIYTKIAVPPKGQFELSSIQHIANNSTGRAEDSHGLAKPLAIDVGWHTVAHLPVASNSVLSKAPNFPGGPGHPQYFR